MSKEMDEAIDKFYEKTIKGTFEGLLNLIEEQMGVTSNSKDLLQEKDMSKSQMAALMTEIPDIPISELGFGDMTTSASGAARSTAERMALKRWTDKIRGGTLPKTLNSLSEFYTTGLKFRSDTSANGRIRTTLSYLAFYKTLTQILSGFNASSAGFTFEAFLAALLGGTQIPTGSKTIADLTDGQGTYISLKLYAEKSVKVGGSWTDLVNDLVDGVGYMHYVVVTKDLVGEGIEQEGTLKWYRFNFDPTNVMSIISKTHKKDILQLPQAFITNGGNINDTLPKLNFSIEELENRFRANLEAGLDNPAVVTALMDTLKWAKNASIFASKGGRTPGRSALLTKQLGKIVDDLIAKDAIAKEHKGAVVKLIHDANSEVVRYNKEATSRRSQAIGSLEYATVEESVKHYNELAPEEQKNALKNTRGYLVKGEWAQFHMSRKDVLNVVTHAGETPGNLFPEDQGGKPFIGETKIGAKYVIEMLQRSKDEVNKAIFEIIAEVKALKVSLDQYFAGGLKDDNKAESAIKSSHKIEGKTGEVSGVEVARPSGVE